MLKQAGKTFDEFKAFEVSFLYEPDGPNERLLKGKLSEVFRHDRSVDRAYPVMARIQGNAGVVLGSATRFGPDERIVKDVYSAFVSACYVKEQLDVMLLANEQEARIAEVCTPFFRV